MISVSCRELNAVLSEVAFTSGYIIELVVRKGW